jgi:hypothetical protein
MLADNSQSKVAQWRQSLSVRLRLRFALVPKESRLVDARKRYCCPARLCSLIPRFLRTRETVHDRGKDLSSLLSQRLPVR